MIAGTTPVAAFLVSPMYRRPTASAPCTGLSAARALPPPSDQATASFASIDSTTKAFIGDNNGATAAKGSVTAGGNLTVKALTNMQLYSVGISSAVSTGLDTPSAPDPQGGIFALFEPMGDMPAPDDFGSRKPGHPGWHELYAKDCETCETQEGMISRITRSIAIEGKLDDDQRKSLMVIADTRSLWVLADVPEARLAGIERGTKAWVTIGSSSDASKPATKIEGTVAFVSPIVDPLTRTAQVRIEVPASIERGLMLRPGMFAVAEIEQQPGGTKPVPVLAIRDEAIQTVEGGPAVFVPVGGETNTFAKRAVTIGKPVGGLVPVLSGLSEGEQFVVAGTFILKAELGKAGAAHEH